MSTNSGKEPWLAVNLSMLFPGIGQIYAGQAIKGWLLIISQFLLQLFGVLLIVVSEDGLALGFSFIFLSILLFIYSLFDAYRSTKHRNSKTFEASRKNNKDPWLAVFLSRILLGSGHLYIGMRSTGIFLVIFALLSLVLPPLSVLGFIIAPFLIFHVYQAAPIRREATNKLIFVFCFLSVFTPVLAILLAFTVRTFIAEARYIPAGSMEPTLQIHDRLVVDKVSYRFRRPERGDIIVFNPTKALKRAKFQEAFIKRIIGIPGDRVEIKNGGIWINGQPLEENYTAEGETSMPNADVCRNNFVTADVNSTMIEPPIPIFLAEPQIIPNNQYLVLGDNRYNSYDGRCWGLVSRNDIIGRATKRFFPLDRAGVIDAGS